MFDLLYIMTHHQYAVKEPFERFEPDIINISILKRTSKNHAMSVHQVYQQVTGKLHKKFLRIVNLFPYRGRNLSLSIRSLVISNASGQFSAASRGIGVRGLLGIHTRDCSNPEEFTCPGFFELFALSFSGRASGGHRPLCNRPSSKSRWLS